jgi:uncharacterized protein YjbI with pentapeptide repeats
MIHKVIEFALADVDINMNNLATHLGFSGKYAWQLCCNALKNVGLRSPLRWAAQRRALHHPQLPGETHDAWAGRIGASRFSSALRDLVDPRMPADQRNAVFDGEDLSGLDFTDCDLSGAMFLNCHGIFVLFCRANMDGAYFEGGGISQAHFGDATGTVRVRGSALLRTTWGDQITVENLV